MTTKSNPSQGGSYIDDGSGPVRVDDLPASDTLPEAAPAVIEPANPSVIEPASPPAQETA